MYFCTLYNEEISLPMSRRRRYRKSIGGNPPIALEKKTIKTILGIGIIGFSLLLLISFFNQSGVLLSIRDPFYKIFGIGIIFVPALMVLVSFPLLSLHNRLTKVNVIFGACGALLAFLGIVGIFSVEFSGVLGNTLAQVLSSVVTPVGAFTVLFLSVIVSIVTMLNTSFHEAVASVVNSIKFVGHIMGRIKSKLFHKPEPKFATRGGNESAGFGLPITKKILPSPKAQKQLPAEGTAGLSESVVSNQVRGQIWSYPPLSLLGQATGAPANRGNIKKNAEKIEKTLESFGITARVAEVNLGPTITQYAIEIPMGTKLSKIVALQNDLALNLATPTGSVRIEAPIPGKSLVGIEIPNISPAIVTLRDLLSVESMRTQKSKLAIGLGLDVSGNPIVSDISKMPHLLIAGTTGSGKSVLINALIATILYRASPQEVKLILVDPKRVELTEYSDIPHLLTPVIVEPDKILSALRWATQEMDRRYKLFHDAQVRNIAGYNELSGFVRLPYIVIVVDELNDLMQFAPVEIEDTIIRLAQMARATGIHLVVATQRPSVDVITGLIKANIPCRIAFNVSSMVDSRVIIDQPGAEKLLGKGDMLYVPPDANKPMRVQGVFVSDTEIRNLIAFLKRSGMAPEYTEEVTQMPVGKIGGKGNSADMNSDGRDDLFEEAVRTICKYDRASASLLQRRLRVGYARAARLIDELEQAGIIGPGDGAKPRDVLVKNPDEYFQEAATQQS